MGLGEGSDQGGLCTVLPAGGRLPAAPLSPPGRDGGAGAVGGGSLPHADPARCRPHAVVSVKPKAQSRQPRLSCYVEVAGDGLPSETKKTGKQMGSSELLWNEILVL